MKHEDKNATEDELSEDGPQTETEEEKSTSVRQDQDSSVSFEIHTDEYIESADVEEEDNSERRYQSTMVVQEKMRTFNISCWIETQRKLKLRLAMRTASHGKERWTKKTARWNPGLSPTAKAGRSVGRPRKRWEDDINEFGRTDETEESKGNDLKNNDTWIWAAKDQKRWNESEKEFMTYRKPKPSKL